MPGLFYQSDWHDSFQVDVERMRSGDSRLVVRTSGATMLVDEWKQLSPDDIHLVFRLNFAPATDNDVEILSSALSRFNAAKRWDRNSDQNCDNDPPGLESLFCVLRSAVTSQLGRYHHAQPAVGVVRAMIAEGFRDRYSGHLLVDFNNHASTTTVEVQRLLQSAIDAARAEAASRK